MKTVWAKVETRRIMLWNHLCSKTHSITPHQLLISIFSSLSFFRSSFNKLTVNRSRINHLSAHSMGIVWSIYQYFFPVTLLFFHISRSPKVDITISRSACSQHVCTNHLLSLAALFRSSSFERVACGIHRLYVAFCDVHEGVHESTKW